MIPDDEVVPLRNGQRTKPGRCGIPGEEDEAGGGSLDLPSRDRRGGDGDSLGFLVGETVVERFLAVDDETMVPDFHRIPRTRHHPLEQGPDAGAVEQDDVPHAGIPHAGDTNIRVGQGEIVGGEQTEGGVAVPEGGGVRIPHYRIDPDIGGKDEDEQEHRGQEKANPAHPRIPRRGVPVRRR